MAQKKPAKKSSGTSQRSRRILIAVTGVVILAAVAVGGWWFVSRPKSPKANVFVFLLDTVRKDALGCYGHPGDPTPQIDALAADGVRFDQCISPSGWTLPAVGTLLTGTWPTLHGAMGRGVMLTRIRDEFPTAAEILREEGMETVGIANASFVSPMVGVDRGFDVFDHMYTYNYNSRPADETISIALKELDRRRSKSGFYFIHLFDAHLDYGPPAPFVAKYAGGRTDPPPPLTADAVQSMQRGEGGVEPPVPEDVDYVRALYQGEIDFVDKQVGRFVERLKELDLYDTATIIITSDHGEEFWEHGGFEHGHTLYDELVLVPLIIKFPAGIEPSSRVVEPQVRLLDVMPTVFEILDVEQPESFIGVSLMPAVDGGGLPQLIALCEGTLYGTPRIALRDRRYKYIMEVSRSGAGAGELYDWRADPGEKRDLAEDLPEVGGAMRAELIRLFTRNADRSATLSQPERVDLDPRRINELRSLGYIR